ncbi:TadE/TadG family type IV pilus assembly protein [Ferrimonas balearica]|uniref:TadE/TadG family type IV pilus assembly protein n=1 Tax=Ferrimonas balearica TaxID=44012 RepID=UPI001C99D4FC|nr:TadE/TadG family type IV pilus assembly protein [Ferrimonas balearica]MBY5992034.1 pilus assembly protein [Ferrimonas balearica]
MKIPKPMGSMQRQRGVAAVEATIALPVLFLIFYAVTEFGRMLYQYQQLNTLARNASRHVISYTSTNSNGDIGVSANVASQARNLAVTGQLTGGTPLLRGLTTADVQISVLSDSVATVTLSYDWTPLFGEAIPGFFGDSIDLSWNLVATATMRPL